PAVVEPVTVYFPGGRLVTVKSPSPVAVVVCSIPVASFLTTTVAPPTPAPFGSTTAPFSVPVVAWAITGALNTKTIVSNASVTVAKRSNLALLEKFILCLLLVSLQDQTMKNYPKETTGAALRSAA